MFELTDVLKAYLSSRKDNLFSNRIKDCITNKLVPYDLVKNMAEVDGEPIDELLPKILRGTLITFRRPPRAELDVVKAARLLVEEREYVRMIKGNDDDNTLTPEQEWRELRQLGASVFNASLSIFGAAFAVYLVCRWRETLSIEVSIVAGLMAGLLVMVAEIFLIAYRGEIPL